MVVLENLPIEGPRRHRHQRSLNVAFLLSVTFILGYLGWILPSAGGSLVIPTLIVLGIGCATAVTWRILFRDWAVVAAVIAIAVVASVWTFAFSLPASLQWDSNATVQAQTELSRLNSSPEKAKGVEPPQPCSVVETGSVGPIEAPYRQCAVFTPEGDSFVFTAVVFTAVGQTSRGLAYTNRGAATFGNDCTRHLIGQWWIFTAETSGSGDCPIGYQFHGGA